MRQGFSCTCGKWCVFVFGAFFVLLGSGIALAEGFALYEYGARGIALGGAVMARKPDPSAVAYNPALITRLPGSHVMAGVTGIAPSGRMKWQTAGGAGGSSSLKDHTWFIPHAYFTCQISDDWYFGVGEFTRFGLGFEYPHNWPGNRNIYEISLETFSINPNIAWKATDELSLAFGVEIVYGVLNLKKRSGVSSAFPQLEMDINMRDMSDAAPGFNVAAHYQFNDQWAAGFQYRSPIKAKLKGDVEFSNINIPPSMYNLKDGKVSVEVTLPESFAVGVSWTPVPEFSIEVGAIRTMWSRFNSLDFAMPHGMDMAKNPKEWKDVWRFNVGLEYQALDWLTLRAGYVFDESPMTSLNQDYLVPTNDRHIYSIGAGMQFDAWTVDLTCAYIDAVSRSYEASSSTHVLKSRSEASSTTIVAFSIGYSF